MMLILKFKNRKGNSSIEYAFLITLVISALIGMQAYLKGPVCQRWRLAGDAFGHGRQYAATAPEPPPIPIVQDPIYDNFKISGISEVNPFSEYRTINIIVDIPCEVDEHQVVIRQLSEDGNAAQTVKTLVFDHGWRNLENWSTGIFFTPWNGKDENGFSVIRSDEVQIFLFTATFELKSENNESKRYSKTKRMQRNFDGTWSEWVADDSSSSPAQGQGQKGEGAQL